MAIPMTMVLDHSGNPPFSPPKLPQVLSASVVPHTASLLRSNSFSVLPATPSSLPLTSYRISPVTSSLSTPPAYATAFQQLRIAAVKYNGQDNDSVIYPPSLGHRPARAFVSSDGGGRRAATIRPYSAFATFKLMISNNAGGTDVWPWNTGDYQRTV